MIKRSTFTPEEELKKQEIKESYLNSVGVYATKQGLADFIWRNLLDSMYDAEKAWDEKRLVVTNLANKYSQKYEPIIETQKKEIQYQEKLIKKLQLVLQRHEPIDKKESQPLTTGCSGCGAKIGCYCN